MNSSFKFRKKSLACAATWLMLAGTVNAAQDLPAKEAASSPVAGQAVVAQAAGGSNAGADSSIKGVLADLLSISPRVIAAYRDKDVSESRAKETFRRAWTPQLEITAEGGQQRYRTDSSPNSDYVNVRRGTVRATQLLFDFGRSNHQVGEAESVARQSAAVAGATADGVFLEALTAHWSVVRSKRVLDYARQSEKTVFKQTQLENSLVDLGKGYESNVLQAKVQLATAEARRVRAEGALEIAEARVAAVFGRAVEKVKYENVVVPLEAGLPKTLEEARSIALENNKQLQVGAHRSLAIQERISTTSAKEFLPSLSAVAEAGQRHNIDGLQGDVNDRKLLLQLQYNFNLGLAGVAALNSAQREYDASVSREVETRDLVLEQVVIAWRNLLVARQNRATLINQVRIAAKFLEMASAERQMGRRSLLDVLTAEVSLINAQSDLATTEADVSIAGLTLLQAIGKLDMNALGLQSSADAMSERNL